MPAISIQDLENAKTDVDHIAEVATSLGNTATDRLGHVKQTLAGAVGSIAAITDRGAWATGSAYLIKDIVTVAGIVYVCVSGHTAGATFAGDSAKWRVYQGLTVAEFDAFVAELASADGAESVGSTPQRLGAVAETVQGRLDSRSANIMEFGGVDDYNGNPYTPNTNNLTAFQKAFVYLNSVGGGDLILPKTKTGGYLINGDDATQCTVPVRLIADAGVSLTMIQSGGAAASPLNNNNISANIEIPKHMYNFGFSTSFGPKVKKTLADTLPTTSNSSGVLAIPTALGGTAFSTYRLSNTAAAIAPVAAVADSLVYAGGGVETLSVIPAKAGTEVGGLILSGYAEKFIAGVITANGYAYFQQDAATGLIEYHEATAGQSNLLFGIPYSMMLQQRDYFNNSVLSVKVTSENSFNVLVNGLVVGSKKTRSTILAAGFGTSNSTHEVSISQMFSIAGNGMAGSKPLNVIICGDSITDNNVQYSHAKYLSNILGTAGVQLAQVNNLAVAGENAAQQYARLQTVGAGYDYCLIQVGVNDCQGATNYAAFVTTITNMVNYAHSIGAQPIVAIPTGFYSLAEANNHGQTGGQDTANNTSMHMYRALLIRAVAGAGGLLNMETIKGYGPTTASLLDIVSYGANDKLLVDNIHPTAYASMMMAHGWARSILGHINMPENRTSETFEQIPSGWLASGFGLLFKPDIRGHELRGMLSLHATNNSDGAVAGTLPEYLRSGVTEMRTVACLSAGGLPTGTCTMYIGASGVFYFFGLPALTTIIALDKVEL